MTTDNYPPVLILYGSQKGQAQAIAEEVLETARQEFSLQVDIACLSQPDIVERLKIGGFVVFIVSTTGEGEPPDSVRKFWKIIKNKELSENILSNLRFSVLGLGDSNYTNFCAMGKNLNQRLLSLGAVPFYAPGFADDGTGMEVVVDPWVDNLWQSFQEFVTGIQKSHKQEFSDNTLLQNTDICSEQFSVILSKQPANSNEYSQELESVVNQIELSAIDISKDGDDCDFISASTIQTDSQIPLLPITSNSVSPVYSNTTSADLNNTNKLYVSTVNTQYYDHLTTPMLQPEYLHLEITEETSDCPLFRFHPIYPHDTISICQLVKAKQLTDTVHYPDVNKVLELDIQMHDPFGFQAGDAVGILCPNDEFEVEYLLERLHLKEKANSQVELSIIPYNKKNGACIPPYIPKGCSVRELLLHHLDIRSLPKKSLLWMLAQYTTDHEESYKLAKLASKEGATEYGTLIRQQSASLMDILYSFPSCNPPLSRLIELLLPLNPRYYSICNSPLTSENTIKIVFSLVHLVKRPWHPNERFGLCTSWLDKLSTQLMTSTPDQGVKQKVELSIIARMVNTFHLPGDVTRPIIMVGPGTGVAPFIGFLEHRERINIPDGTQLGTSYLFFGCRHSKGDFLFKEELNNFKTNKILTKLETAFSRDPDYKHHYVQDSMIENGEELIRLVQDEDAVIFLCGDITNMAPDVRAAWIKIFEKFGGLTSEEAVNYFKELQKSKRYIQDIWA